MKISTNEVKHIAMLSRLELDDKERDIYQDQLSRILEYVEKLSEIDTREIEPTSHVIELSNVFREDEVTKSLSKRRSLKKCTTNQQINFLEFLNHRNRVIMLRSF